MFEEFLKQKPGVNVETLDFRLAILNTLLITPHRDLEAFIPFFKHVEEVDPMFFSCLAVYYMRKGTVKDFQDLFLAVLCASKQSPALREAGLALTMQLPPFRVARVLGLLKGHERKIKHKPEPVVKGKKAAPRKPAEVKYIAGVAPNVPSSFKTAIREYLQIRENNPRMFSSILLRSREDLKTLYASLHIKPGQAAKDALFSKKAPEGSANSVVKQIAESADSAEQARLIVENKIPYTVATSLVDDMSAPVLAALITVMSPQEVINNLSSLEARGVFDVSELKELVDKKLEAAGTDSNVSALKTRLAAQRVNAETAAKVTAVGDKQLKSKARITKNTALLVDKSGSLKIALDVGMRVASVIAPVCSANLYVYAFDTIAYPLRSAGTELSHWEAAFGLLKANGGTSGGAAVNRMTAQNQIVDQIIVVTDQDDNANPYITPSLQEYTRRTGAKPNVVIVNVGDHNKNMETPLRAAGYEVDVYTFSGDYYSLPSLLPMLEGGSKADLLAEILELPLPVRNREKQKQTANV